MNGDLIACARYHIYDEQTKALERNKIWGREGTTHVLFIINLPRQVSGSSGTVGFQGDPWISAHIDDLGLSSSDTVEPLRAISTTISEVFIGGYVHDIGSLMSTADEDQHQHDPATQTPHPVEVYPDQQDDLTHAGKTHLQSQDVQFINEEPKVPRIPVAVNVGGATNTEVLPSKPKKRVIKQNPVAQYRRLYSCIQAAALKVEDSTKDRSTQRVKRLTRLIPRKPDCLSKLVIENFLLTI